MYVWFWFGLNHDALITLVFVRNYMALCNNLFLLHIYTSFQPDTWGYVLHLLFRKHSKNLVIRPIQNHQFMQNLYNKQMSQLQRQWMTHTDVHTLFCLTPAFKIVLVLHMKIHIRPKLYFSCEFHECACFIQMEYTTDCAD